MNLPEQPSDSPSPAQMRASDADRDSVADRLREALAEGRITPEEHAERIDAVYSAKTYADLEPVLADLPSEQAPRPRVDLRKEEVLPPPPPQSSTLVAIFSGVERKGRWLVEEQTNVACVFGGAELDFRQAVLSRREVTVNITCVFGGVNIVVPPGVRVQPSMVSIFGGTDSPGDDTIDADAPVIKLTGMNLFGGVSITRREVGETRRERRRRERERHLEHMERHLERHQEHLERHLERREEHRRRRDERRDHLRELREERRRHR
ncbi:DUF1707 SHOCT-like domain-containing protein [Actinomadura fibrosa]|uniref:DUF1707 domain-containing protein n=1 Tax=Actinomadura fibrosa TaxID=111802 RepID=A0ABW2XRW8_9ACTN|nr:DUF1707 domain-containing protein [Actinomadura fibrosa]